MRFKNQKKIMTVYGEGIWAPQEQLWTDDTGATFTGKLSNALEHFTNKYPDMVVMVSTHPKESAWETLLDKRWKNTSRVRII